MEISYLPVDGVMPPDQRSPTDVRAVSSEEEALSGELRRRGKLVGVLLTLGGGELETSLVGEG